MVKILNSLYIERVVNHVLLNINRQNNILTSKKHGTMGKKRGMQNSKVYSIAQDMLRNICMSSAVLFATFRQGYLSGRNKDQWLVVFSEIARSFCKLFNCCPIKNVH